MIPVLIYVILASRLRARAQVAAQAGGMTSKVHSLVAVTSRDDAPKSGDEPAKLKDLEASWQSEVDSRKRTVRFNSRVSCSYLKDLKDVPTDVKSKIWFQQEDFDLFLNTRVDIGKAYRAAAKKLGLEIMQVSSVGSHGDEGYLAMIQAYPDLKGESRRGLGLGRKRQRAKSRDAYIAAVLNEQRRQQRAAAQSGVPFVLDEHALSAAARQESEKDMEYALELANTYYRQDRAVEANAPACDEVVDPCRDEDSPSPPMKQNTSSSELGSGLEESPSTLLRGTSFNLNDEGAERSPPGTLAAKGFGLSREKLQMVGLSATGHYGRKRNDEESEATAGESEEDIGLFSNAEHIAQYRKWRSGEAVHVGLPGQGDTKSDDEKRKEYRVWRLQCMAKANEGRSV